MSSSFVPAASTAANEDDGEEDHIMTLREIQREIKKLTKLAHKGVDIDEKRFDFLLKQQEANIEYQAILAEERENWRESVEEFATQCLQRTRSFVPLNIFETSFDDLVKLGLTEELAKRILQRKCLWLTRMSKEEISRLHESDLLGRFNSLAQGMDIIETAAIYASLPENFAHDHSERKKGWRNSIEDNLRQMLEDNDADCLADTKIRNPAYDGYQFGPVEDLESVRKYHVTTGRDYLKPRRSWMALCKKNPILSKLKADSDEAGDDNGETAEGSDTSSSSSGSSRSDDEEGEEEGVVQINSAEDVSMHMKRRGSQGSVSTIESAQKLLSPGKPLDCCSSPLQSPFGSQHGLNSLRVAALKVSSQEIREANESENDDDDDDGTGDDDAGSYCDSSSSCGSEVDANGDEGGEEGDVDIDQPAGVADPAAAQGAVATEAPVTGVIGAVGRGIEGREEELDQEDCDGDPDAASEVVDEGSPNSPTTESTAQAAAAAPEVETVIRDEGGADDSCYPGIEKPAAAGKQFQEVGGDEMALAADAPGETASAEVEEPPPSSDFDEDDDDDDDDEEADSSSDDDDGDCDGDCNDKGRQIEGIESDTGLSQTEGAESMPVSTASAGDVADAPDVSDAPDSVELSPSGVDGDGDGDQHVPHLARDISTNTEDVLVSPQEAPAAASVSTGGAGHGSGINVGGCEEGESHGVEDVGAAGGGDGKGLVQGLAEPSASASRSTDDGEAMAF